MKEWVARNYRGTKLALTEYNLSVDGDAVTNGLIQADVLGIFAREGLDLATRWGMPFDGDRIDDAFRLYRDYDGHGAKFGDVWIRSRAPTSRRLAVYGARRTADGAYTVIVINKTADALTSRIDLRESRPRAPRRRTGGPARRFGASATPPCPRRALARRTRRAPRPSTRSAAEPAEAAAAASRVPRVAITLITIAVIALAVVAALLYNRHVWRPRQARDSTHADGLNATEASVPLVTLAVLLLTFVLVQVFGSWSAVSDQETAEATATLQLFREAQLFDDVAVRAELEGDVVCYAISVAEQDWPAMGDREVSSVPTYWGQQIRDIAAAELRKRPLRAGAHDLIEHDGDRSTARQARLAEARPTIPTALYVLLLLVVATTLVMLSVITAASVRPTSAISRSCSSRRLAFGATLLLIRDLDQPYDGVTGRSPAETEFIVDLIRPEAPAPLPCDDGGPADR